MGNTEASAVVVAIMLGLACAVVIALNIVLFFKIWGMTNDVRDIKKLLGERLDSEQPADEGDREEDK